jgi:lysophospholipase L1-like esterase
MKITNYTTAAALTNTVKVPVLQDGTLKLTPMETFNIDRPVFISNRNEFYMSDNPYTATTATDPTLSQCFRAKRWSHKTLTTVGPRLVFTTSRLTASGETQNANNIMVRASVENLTAGGIPYPVFFNGRREVTIEPGGFVISDPVGVSLPPNTAFYVRTNVRVANENETWPAISTIITADGESATAADNTDTTTSMGGSTNGGRAMFAPVAILGSVGQKVPSVLLLGSSSAYGTGDSMTASDNPNRDNGYLSRMLSNEFCYAKQCRASHTLLHYMTDSRRRLALITALKPTHVICQIGGNDITNGANLATVQSRFQSVWSTLTAQGIKVIQSTITPTTTSTDAWATVENQTVVASNAVRVQVNDWIRTTPTGLWGFIDPAAVVESSSNSGKWRVDGGAWSYDGTHLTAAAHYQTTLGLIAAGGKNLFTF